jgi:hypothetical protein
MRTTTVVGDDLFHIAARYLGDATQWIRIAQLNNMSDPRVAGTATLLLPPVDPQAGGGVAIQ